MVWFGLVWFGSLMEFLLAVVGIYSDVAATQF